MDLTQSKLTKTEWDSIETPIEEKEKIILKMIIEGYDNINIRYNDNQSMLSFLQMPNDTPGIHEHLYEQYFKDEIKKIDSDLVTHFKGKKQTQKICLITYRLTM